MGCSQTLSQQNTAMKAALVTLQKKLRGHDAQFAELAHEKGSLHCKVSNKLYSCMLYAMDLGQQAHTLCRFRSGQPKADQRTLRHNCKSVNIRSHNMKLSSKSSLCIYGKHLCQSLYTSCSFWL